ncbi:MAG: phosphoribosylanthranilate isomerase [Actinomycetia bacterium]|nr:phosphoribosylanthranilate isomerase [Actinomycetes bacterium]
MRPIVKICGLMRAKDLRMCHEAGADLLGFVVDYPHPVPWNLSVGLAGRLLAGAPDDSKTCIVTSGSPEKVLHIAEELKPGYIQLHGDETPEETAYLVRELGKQNIKVIKAVFPTRPTLIEDAAAYCEAGVQALLFDPRAPETAAEGGAADLAAFRKLQSAVNCPVILAGGIDPDNAAGMVALTQAPMIDVMSGVESSPGVKDAAKVRALFASLQAARDQEERNDPVDVA